MSGRTYEPCGLMMVGQGTDTYDPTCDLRKGHDGPCKSTAAISQHRLAEYPPDHPARRYEAIRHVLERWIMDDLDPYLTDKTLLDDTRSLLRELARRA